LRADAAAAPAQLAASTPRSDEIRETIDLLEIDLSTMINGAQSRRR
jgi:hypothetical protein